MLFTAFARNQEIEDLKSKYETLEKSVGDLQEQVRQLTQLVQSGGAAK